MPILTPEELYKLAEIFLYSSGYNPPLSVRDDLIQEYVIAGWRAGVKHPERENIEKYQKMKGQFAVRGAIDGRYGFASKKVSRYSNGVYQGIMDADLEDCDNKKQKQTDNPLTQIIDNESEGFVFRYLCSFTGIRQKIIEHLALGWKRPKITRELNISATTYNYYVRDIKNDIRTEINKRNKK